MKNTIFVISVISIFSGCASVTEPVSIGDNLYLVNSQTSGTFYSWGETKNIAIVKANEFCDGKGKKMTIEGEEYSGARSWVPIEAHIKFRCQ